MNERMKKIKFVVNPISGTQSKELILNLLDEKIDKARYSWEVVNTERAGHAVEIAAKAAEEKTDIVVAIGGDGTINEIARSLVHTDTALGIIPCGSGNGLARHLHIPMEPKRALEVLNEGCMDVIDYGKINGTDFFCTCGVGFDAFVSLKFAHAGKRGVLTYLEKTLQESLKYEPETYELETENGVSKYKGFPDCLWKRVAIWKQCLYRPTSYADRWLAGCDHSRTVHRIGCPFIGFSVIQ